MGLTEIDRPRNHARQIVGLERAGLELIEPEGLGPVPLGRLEAGTRDDVAQQLQGALQVALQHRDVGLGGVLAGLDRGLRPQLVEETGDLQRAVAPGSLLHHLGRERGEPTFARGIVGRPSGDDHPHRHQGQAVAFQEPDRGQPGDVQHLGNGGLEGGGGRQVRTGAEVGHGRRGRRDGGGGHHRGHLRASAAGGGGHGQGPEETLHQGWPFWAGA